MESKPFGLAVGALIDNGKGEYLLLQRSDASRHFAGAWEPPGGKLDAGESFAEALVREAKEECGLDIHLESLAGASEFELSHIRVVVLYMNARTASCDIVLSEEHQDYVWLPVSDFRTKTLTPAFSRLLEERDVA